MEDLGKVFQRFDRNGDKKITTEELKEVIGAFTPAVSTKEVASIMEEFDLDGNGFIDMDEFMAIFRIGDRDADGDYNNDLKDVFDLYVTDGL